MQGYPQRAIDYFVEIAIGTQYGQENATIHKWDQDIRVQVFGQTTVEDRNVLDRVLGELNGLLQGIRIDLVESSPNTKMYFVPPAEFLRIEPHYVPPNTAFFWSRWNDWSIYESTILIASEGISQQKRDHHIVAMLCKNLGLMKRSSSLPPESIFFNGENKSIMLVDIDRAIVQMLYDVSIRHGMTVDEIRAALPVSSVHEVTRANVQMVALYYCPHCGAELKGTERYCGTCGSSVTTMN